MTKIWKGSSRMYVRSVGRLVGKVKSALMRTGWVGSQRSKHTYYGVLSSPTHSASRGKIRTEWHHENTRRYLLQKK